MYSQKYSVNVGVLQGSIICPLLSLLYINDFSNFAVCNIVVYPADTFLYPKCRQTSGLWQHHSWPLNLNLTTGLKWMDLSLKKNYHYMGLFISSKLYWGFYIVFFAKTAS